MLRIAPSQGVATVKLQYQSKFRHRKYTLQCAAQPEAACLLIARSAYRHSSTKDQESRLMLYSTNAVPTESQIRPCRFSRSRRFLRFAYIRQDQLRWVLAAKVNRVLTTIEFMLRPRRRPSCVFGNAVILAAHTQGNALTRGEVHAQGPYTDFKLDNGPLGH